MKLSNLVILFFILTLPVFFYLNAKAEKTTDFTYINQQHEGAMTVAAHDAVNVLRTNVVPELEVSYYSYKINPADPQKSFDTFLQSLALNYRVQDSVTADLMARYVPAYAIVDYDGLLLNVYKNHKDSSGTQVLDRVWLPKIPFSYTDTEGNVINFTIDEDLEVYDAELNEWFYGKRHEVIEDVTIDLLEDDEKFDQVRRSTIVNTLQENLAYYINEHNVYTKALDVTYTFTMPLIPEEDWYNTVDDVSILAFFQGYPYRMADEQYQEYAFVGTRLNKRDTIKAGIVNDQRKYWYDSCGFPYKATELYSTKKQAAAAGYSELSCLNP
jgi:hypothetical protein